MATFDFNPITGRLDLVGTGGSTSTTQNFSYSRITTGNTVTIPEYQQMLFVGNLTIDGTLVIDGEAIEVIS